MVSLKWSPSHALVIYVEAPASSSQRPGSDTAGFSRGRRPKSLGSTATIITQLELLPYLSYLKPDNLNLRNLKFIPKSLKFFHFELLTLLYGISLMKPKY